MNKVEEAAERLKSLTKRPSNEELLELYGLYKQATAGDNKTSQPATRNPQLATRNSQPATRNPKPATRNSQP
jgi:acyl-CoA-binding protein